MWIGIMFVIAGAAYLVWSLLSGRIFVTLGTDLHRKTRLVSRDERPKTFWLTWVISAIGLLLISVFLIRTALS